MTQASLLIVDDIEANRAALKMLLRDMGVVLHEASNGFDALMLTLENEYAAILLDIQMPEMDGYEVCESIRENPETTDVPVIFLTAAFSDDDHRLQGYLSGATDYITKPINDRVLKAKISSLLRLYHQKKDLEAINSQLKQEVEARKQAESEAQQALADLNAQRFALDEHAIVAVTDVKGTITYANKKFCEISGYSREELIGQNHRILRSDYHDKAFWQAMYRQVANGKVWHGEVCNQAKNGGFYWVDTTVAPYLDNKGKPKAYISIRTDITQIKKTQEALRESNAKAERAAQAKSEFLAMMSHEIRTPMNGVLGMLSLLQQTPLTEQQQHKASVAQSSAQSLLTLINDILDFSKIDAGKLDLELRDFNLLKTLEEFSEAMAYRAQDKGLDIVVDTTGMQIPHAKGDEGRIRQILTNLVGNAVKFTEHGGIQIIARTSSENEKILFECEVIDSGIGIPEDKQGNLFTPFNQADVSTTRKFGGTGLGLAIVKRLCQLMHGEVTLSSKEGQGTCFSIRLQLEPSSTSHSLRFPSLTGHHCCILDTQIMSRDYLTKLLERQGAKIEATSDLEQAKQLITNENKPRFSMCFIEQDANHIPLLEAIQALPSERQPRVACMHPISQSSDSLTSAQGVSCAHITRPITQSALAQILAYIDKPTESNDEAQSTEQQPSTASYPWQADSRILVVEDNMINQEVAGGVLASFNLTPDFAADGQQALDCLKKAAAEEAPYSLIFMDCQMPVMDGVEASQQIRQGAGGDCHTDIAIVAMTANAMKGDRERCLEAGMNDYLSKPFELDIFREKLERWL
jgi:polar amino acid transport system substrate-binding protein